MSKKEELKRQILQLTREYYNEVHKTSKVFEPGKSFVNYGGRYFNDEEMVKGNVMTEYESKFSAMGNPIHKLIASR